MPMPIAAKAGVIAISAAVAAAIALYESPEFRRVAEDLRRRIAIALHSIGDNIDAPRREDGQPVFNRPEDAEGFVLSRAQAARGGEGGGVDADEESKRRQREELMYWNAVLERKRIEKEREEEQKGGVEQDGGRKRGTSFDDFLHQDGSAAAGTFVFNSGTDVKITQDAALRHRGVQQSQQPMRSFAYSNPFGDEHGISADEHDDARMISPDQDETMTEPFTDIYNATDRDATPSRTLSPRPVSPAQLIDIHSTAASSHPEADSNDYATAHGDDDEDTHNEAYASIQAWAQQSHPDFYSPLPTTPAAPMSEVSSDPEMLSAGQLTPTSADSISVIDAVSGSANETSRNVVSRFEDAVSSDDGMSTRTPASWTEVGSVMSESEAGVRVPN